MQAETKIAVRNAVDLVVWKFKSLLLEIIVFWKLHLKTRQKIVRPPRIGVFQCRNLFVIA